MNLGAGPEDPLADLPEPTRTRVERVLSMLADHPGVLAVAISGGVDSAVLAALARRARPGVAVPAGGADPLVAVVGVSAAVPEVDVEDARAVARWVGVELLELPTFEFDSPDYLRNDVDRCYHCRSELFSRIDSQLAEAYGIAAVAYGEIVDDRLSNDRPGARAAAEHGVLAPLADAGITKAEVRELAHRLGLPVAEKPAAPCLASRVPFGTPVTVGLLGRVERAEAAVRAAGVVRGPFRVRAHGPVARLEFDAADLAAVSADQRIARLLCDAVTTAGFDRVVIDPDGFESGRFARLAAVTPPDRGGRSPADP